MTARSTFRALGLTLGLPVMALSLLGCNTVDSTAEATMAEQRMARPAAIVVQEFAISPDAAQPPAAPAASASGNAAEQAAEKFRESLAAHLVSAIRAMGLPAVSTDAALPSSGNVMTLEGAFVSVPGGDSVEPAIVSLADSWPDVVVDVEIYDTSDAGDRLVEDMEFRISETNPLIPGGEPGGEPTAPQRASGAAQPAISPAIQAKLDAAARDGADAIARQLRPFFEDQGWIARPAGS
ncbi:MAG: DUF4410 domain-containing protein [Geminicoccaceae bacterium]